LRIVEKNNTKYIAFDIFNDIDFLTHGISTKVGGVSKGHYAEMNLGFLNGDNKDDVLENYKIISDAIGFDYKNIVLTKQEHENNVMIVDESHKGNGVTKENIFKNIDGLVTNKKNIVLGCYSADCVLMFFADKVKKVIGVCHAGWRGTVLKIPFEVVKIMINNYNTNVEDLIVGIAPSICRKHFEVDYPCYAEFKNAFDFIDEYTIYKSEKEKYYIDLHAINKRVLTDCGVSENNIELPNLCTVCNNDIFHSHRISGTKRGLSGGFLEIK